MGWAGAGWPVSAGLTKSELAGLVFGVCPVSLAGWLAGWLVGWLAELVGQQDWQGFLDQLVCRSRLGSLVGLARTRGRLRLCLCWQVGLPGLGLAD